MQHKIVVHLLGKVKNVDGYQQSQTDDSYFSRICKRYVIVHMCQRRENFGEMVEFEETCDVYGKQEDVEEPVVADVEYLICCDGIW